MENVLDFQPNGVANNWSWAAVSSNFSLLNTGMTSLAALTFCVRILIPFYRNPYTVVTFTNEDFANYFSLGFDVERTTLTLVDDVWWAPITAIPGFWNHICLRIDFTNMMWTLNINEEEFQDFLNTTSGMMTPRPVFAVFGQSIDEYDGGYVSSLSFYGKLTHFYLWNRLLKDEEVDLYSDCGLRDENSLLKWNTSKMIVNGTTSIVSIPKVEVCRPRDLYRVLLSPPLLMPVAESICLYLGGNLSTSGFASIDHFEAPQLSALHSEDSDQTIKSISELKSFALLHEKDKWRTLQNRIMSKSSKYSKLKSNAIQSVNVAKHNLRESKSTRLEASELLRKRRIRQAPSKDKPSQSDEEKGFSDEIDFTAYCDFFEPPVIRLNGFCPDMLDVLDESYVVIGKRNGKELPIFQGFTGAEITYSRGMWIANSPYSSIVEVWFEDPIEDPTVSPLGRNMWLVMVTVNEELLEKDVKLPCDSEYLYLNLSPCPFGQFTCSAGSCLPINVRCDRKADCSDYSDEEHCFKVQSPENNRNDLPSKPLNGENVTYVELKLHIIEAKIDLDIMTLSTDIWMTWKDPALIYYNLQTDPMANLVDVDSLHEIWIPTLEFGDKGKQRIQMTNQSEVFVIKESFGTLEDYVFSWEATSYKGSENYLQLKEKVDIKSQCTFNTFLFPFGLQTCLFSFVLTSSLPEVISLASSGYYAGVSWSRSNDDLKYSISSIQLSEISEGMYSSQQLKIEIYPRLGLALLALYFPSCFIVIIAISSFYFKLENLQPRIGTALICLIAMLLLQIQVGSPLLGKTGVNAADIWLFGANIIVFGVNIAHVRIVRSLQTEEERRPNTMQVVPMAMVNGKPSNSKTKTLSVEEAWALSNKCRVIFTLATTLMIIIYAIVFVALTSVYKN